MTTTYVCGHRNPDVDSVCAAHCYASLKRRLDPEADIIPIRIGGMNRQTIEIFERAGVNPPLLIKDLYPRVADVVRPSDTTLHIDSTIFKTIQLLAETNLSALSVFDERKNYAGMVSTNELARYLATENQGIRPTYLFKTGNFFKIIPGRFLRPGNSTTFHACIMTGAMPKERCLEHLKATEPVKPLMVAGLRPEIITYAVACDCPAIVLTGLVGEDDLQKAEAVLKEYRGTVYLSSVDTAETIRLLRLSSPVSCIMDTTVPRIQADALYDEVRERLTHSEFRGFPVFDGETYIGMVSRRCFIDRPRKQLIMVDHNEASQSVEGVEELEVIEIIDHHRLGAFRTRRPIYIASRPVGSTCTIVGQHYAMHGLSIPPEEAMLLLAGVLTDTVNLRSPTATREDQMMAATLAEVAGVDLQVFGRELYSHTTILQTCDPRETILSDFKEYRESNVSFGIGQVEVAAFAGLHERAAAFSDELSRIREERKLDWSLLMVTHVLKEKSVLFSSGCENLSGRFIYHALTPGRLFEMPGVLSRKKQLLPEVLRVLQHR